MKVDLYTASAVIKNLVDTKPGYMKGSTRQKIMTIINKGRKDQFLRLVDMLYK